ncbi:HdeD family acid-resistance protein [Flavobacterium antarcticum]|uniref:HdeD family acid-resistance protein n=1 Tax=Flavobacterium antarcticum TaxID=271155 RepID=UPI0003B43B2D|nr:DUF308 domain-containing protein [Flavobacterium antarcticum]
MEKSFLDSIKTAIKHWYVPLLIGIFFIVVSIVAFTSPISSLLTLSMLFAISFLFGGISEVLFSIVNRNQLDNWGWSLTFGIITLLVGFSLLIHPAISIGVMAFYIGFVILFRSASAISFSLDIKSRGGKNWAMLLALGILGIIFSFILIWNPIFAGLSVIWLISITFMIAGLFSIALSFQLKNLHKNRKQISANLRMRFEDLQQELREEWRN